MPERSIGPEPDAEPTPETEPTAEPTAAPTLAPVDHFSFSVFVFFSVIDEFLIPQP